MTNIKVDAFSIYGEGVSNSAGAVINAMLAGPWAEVDLFVAFFGVDFGLPWDATDETWWITGRVVGVTSGHSLLRGVLPSAMTEVVFSFHYAVDSLPQANSILGPIDFRNGANNVIGTLFIQSTGAVAFNYGAGTVVSSGPVIVAEREHHFELRIKTDATTAFQLYVDDVLVLNASGWAPTNAGPVEQFMLLRQPSELTSTGIGYLSHFIVRSLTGSYNNSFPIGDRRVATLLVDDDDEDHQGWTPQPLQRFGTGVLDLATTANAAVFTAASITATNLGAVDFTIEGQFRFDVLPSGSTQATLFSKWRTDNNQRSYQFYKGGPGFNNGHLVFETSTDGTSGTVAIKLEWPWDPQVGVWYHIALCRESGALRLFIDGIEQGLPIADGDTYFAGSARTVMGAQQSNVGGVAQTFDGWMDEVRLTVGLSRYTANFAPPTDKFPRGVDDPDWANVALLAGFDSGIADDGPNVLTLSAVNSAVAITPGDGAAAYETLNKHTPSDITFIEAALIPATGTFTLTDLPTATETVTLGSETYTFVAALTTAFDVLIGADIEETMFNLISAINGEAGEGVIYGTGTTVNADASAELLPSDQMLATASTPGAVGNSVASTDTCADGSWTDTTLDGGQDIPGYSAFGLEPLPRGVTVVDSITLVTRQWKTDAGAATTQTAFEGPGGAADQGTDRPISTTPTFYMDTFEEDPDTSGVLTPATINDGQVRINRTT